MYNVSEEYKEQLHKPVFKFDLSGRLTGTGDIYADNILAGSLTITNQCASGDRIIMGSVYVGELRATFVNTNDIEVGATITLTESLYVDELDRYEDVPLGAFKVAEALKTRSGIEVVAYDYMSKFDKAAELAEVGGTVFEWLRYCCSMCNVTMAQTQLEIESLPNGRAYLTCYLEEGFTATYRDVVSWLAQVIGGFATVDRTGKVKLVSYASQAPIFTITSLGRYNDYSFSLCETGWDAISYVSVTGDEKETRVVGEPTSADTTFSFGYNPFLQNTVDADQLLLNLLTVAESMVYVPFKIRVPSGACYDLGDILSMFGGHAPNPITSRYCVTNIEWKYNGGTTLGGAGKNLSIGAGGSSGGSGGGGGGAGGVIGGGDIMRFYNFTNARAINILDGTYEDIIDIRFNTKKATTVIFQAEILLETTAVSGETLSVAKAVYELNGTEDNTYYPTESWYENGKHILHLLYFIPIEGESSNRLTVKLEMLHGDTDIGAQQIKACIYGQGLAAQEAEWDGYINAEDNLYGYEADITGITSIGGMSGTVAISQDTPHTRALSDSVEAVDIDGIGVAGISDILQIDKEPLTTLTWGEVGAYTWGYVEDNYMW